MRAGDLKVAMKDFKKNNSRRNSQNSQNRNNSNTQTANKVILTCQSCGQKVRVPSGRGRIMINCPKCHGSFIART